MAHAGEYETAMMLHLRPELVHMERAVVNYPPVFDSPLLSPDGRPACAWSARDFGPSGIIGDPLPATQLSNTFIALASIYFCQTWHKYLKITKKFILAF